ncbi:MAG TPA: hypothetical protein VME45_19955 [Stellaceae bacterium]|nr:hypothetical protein [Stellaceae bacterium]
MWSPFSRRFLQVGRRLLFYDEGPFKPDKRASTAYNRGAIEDLLKYLTDNDRQAIAIYLLAQKPVMNEVRT